MPRVAEIEMIIRYIKPSIIIVSLLTNPTDIWNLSTRIFGQLDGIHALYGSGEIFAHLEYLEAMNLVTSSDGLYSLTTPSVDVLTIF